MNLFILRHAETEFNRLGIVQGSGVDTSINDTGRWQARAFFAAYRDQPFELVVTSGLKRTHETVEPFLENNISWVQRPEINEISWGTHEGQPSSPERLRLFKQTLEHWRNGQFDAALPQGESARQLADRVQTFLDWLQTRPEQHILVCTHGRTLRCLVALMKNKPLTYMERVDHQNTGCFVARWHPPAYTFLRENDTGHLRNLDIIP